MKKTYLLMGVGLASLATSANATVITFDNLATDTIVSNQYAGVTFSAGTGGLTVPNPTNTTQGFASNTGMGVTPLSGGDVGGGAGSPLSGMILHRFSADWLAEDGDPVFVITFASSITDISIDFGGVATPASTAIYAYAGGVQVASAAGTSTGSFTLSLTGLSGVTQVAVTPGDFGDWVGVDNVNYTTSSVPEPAALAVLGFGVVAMLRRRRK